MKKIIITFFAILTTFAQSAFAGVDKGINVKEVQMLLAELCYDPGSIDGLWGKKTETAVKDLYGSVKGSYDGQFDLIDLGFLREYPIWHGGGKCESSDLVESMDESFEVATEKEVQIVDPEVCKAQESLSQLGYDIGIADGILRTETLNSLDSFFTSQNMTFEGELEAKKISYLQKAASKNFARLSGFATEYKNDFNQKSYLRDKFFHNRIHQEKIENHFSDTCGVAKIICCKGPRSKWDTDSERVELELELHPLKREYEMQFLFRSNGHQLYSKRVLISQFKGHTNKVNGVYPNADPPVAVYAHKLGRVSCVNFLDVNQVKYFTKPVILENGYLTDGKWHHVKMKWRLSRTGEDSLCEVIVDGQTQISMQGLRTVPFGLNDRGSARIGPYRDNDDYIQSFYFDNWIVGSKY